MTKKKKIDLVILAGGKGRRIKKYLKNSPKPMLKVNEKYFLNYVLKQACKYNFNNCFILTRYKKKIIFNQYDKKNFNFVNIHCLSEKKEMGTGGALFFLKNKIQDFVLINGDTLFDINFEDLIRSKKKNSIGSIALTKNHKQQSEKLNNISISNNLIFTQKKSKFMNGGIYFFSKKILKIIPNKKISLENEILPELIKKKKINGRLFNNFFLDIGSEKTLISAPKKIIKNFKKPAVFLDRDGVLNYDYGYVYKFKDFKFREGVLKGLQYLTKKNFNIFIVTNQAGIAKKKFTLKQFKDLHIKIKNFMIKKNIYISDLEYSPYHTESKIKKYRKKSATRKPGNLMIKKIMNNWDVNIKKSFMIGDKKTDFQAAKKSNLKFHYAEKNFYKQIIKIINNY